MYGGKGTATWLGWYGFRVVTGDDWDLLWTMQAQYRSLNGSTATEVGTWVQSSPTVMAHDGGRPLSEGMAPKGYAMKPWQRHNRCASTVRLRRAASARRD